MTSLFYLVQPEDSGDPVGEGPVQRGPHHLAGHRETAHPPGRGPTCQPFVLGHPQRRRLHQLDDGRARSHRTVHHPGQEQVGLQLELEQIWVTIEHNSPQPCLKVLLGLSGRRGGPRGCCPLVLVGELRHNIRLG